MLIHMEIGTFSMPELVFFLLSWHLPGLGGEVSYELLVTTQWTLCLQPGLTWGPKGSSCEGPSGKHCCPQKGRTGAGTSDELCLVFFSIHVHLQYSFGQEIISIGGLLPSFLESSFWRKFPQHFFFRNLQVTYLWLCRKNNDFYTH